MNLMTLTNCEDRKKTVMVSCNENLFDVKDESLAGL